MGEKKKVASKTEVGKTVYEYRFVATENTVVESILNGLFELVQEELEKKRKKESRKIK